MAQVQDEAELLDGWRPETRRERHHRPALLQQVRGLAQGLRLHHHNHYNNDYYNNNDYDDNYYYDDDDNDDDNNHDNDNYHNNDSNYDNTLSQWCVT